MTDALVRLDGLRVHYGPVRAVDGVDLQILRGETLALVGESGCGKSTLARALIGLEKPSAGSVHFDGQPLEAFPARSRRARCKDLQMVFQDPDASLNPRMTIQGAIGEPLELHERPSRTDRQHRVLELMRDVGLDPALRLRYPHELSGGQRQRVCIARALAVRPKLLVCDEAVSALDVSVQAQILNLLLELKQSFGLAYLFITHDLRVVRHIADRVAVMYLGQIVEFGPTDRIFTAPSHPYTRVLLASVPAIGAEQAAVQAAAVSGEPPSPSNPPPGCRFQTRCPSVMPRCRTEAPPLFPLPDRQTRCFLVEPTPAAPALAVGAETVS
jgi:oligopeptide/dipeptide ABC transporter ATP-binding protein